MNILINGVSNKSAGGKSILINLVASIKKLKSNHLIYILVNTSIYEELKVHSELNIRIVEVKVINISIIGLPFYFLFWLDSFMKRNDIDVCVNLADIPIKTKIKQVFLFDWAFAVYPKDIVWDKLSLFEKYYKRIKILFFKVFKKSINIILAQTDIIADRLSKFYQFSNIKIAPNAVSLDNLDSGIHKKFNLPEGPKFLYLTRYYPHKNLEIFLPLAKKIKESEFDCSIIITIASDQSKSAAAYLNEIKNESLDSVIINVGSVNMEHVPSLYKQCNYLLMPTLLESFSGTYVEAMYHKLPILTSDLDFAHAVCRDAALYFNPLDVDSILKTMTQVLSDDLADKYAQKGTDVLSKMATWDDTTKIILQSIDEVAND